MTKKEAQKHLMNMGVPSSYSGKTRTLYVKNVSSLVLEMAFKDISTAFKIVAD